MQSHDHINVGHMQSHDHMNAGHMQSHDHMNAGHMQSHDHINAGHMQSHDHINAGHMQSHDHMNAGHMQSHAVTRPPTYQVGLKQLVHKLKVLWTVDISVLHELQVLLIHTALNLRRHCVQEHATLLTLLDKSLRIGGGRGREERGRGERRRDERVKEEK